MPSDLRTQAIVLRRTNYGETDRILNLLTPEGKFAVLARGVRKEKSRLAGGIELFSVADIVIHQGRTDLGTLTGAKMLRFYSNIIADLSRLELASACLRKSEQAAESTDSAEYFQILDQTLAGLHQHYDLTLIKAWFTLNLAQATGEEINFMSDVDGCDLSPEQTYHWDYTECALHPDNRGSIGASQIKLGRLILSHPLATIARIEQAANLVAPLDVIVRAFE